VIKIEWLVMMY